MATVTFDHSVTRSNEGTNILTNFMNWCTAQEENRLLWTGLGLGIHGCISTPITVLTLLILGGGLFPIALAIIAMTAVLVVNLAALPAKITIPVFAASLLVDVALVLAFLL